ncbi:MAG: YbiU family protein, partial [SAR324 cluster bacterium]|nr:YbiU family protein [SAR324 cluster bacterium]
RNQTFLERQKPCFLEGRSSPDFAEEDYEMDFQGRALMEDLTPLGRKQMGFDSW